MPRRWLMGILAIFLTGCGSALSAVQVEPLSEPEEVITSAPAAPSGTSTQDLALQPVHAGLEDLGTAPELENEVWLNVDAPLRLADLRGKVVLLDMWTFGCINCQHVIPSLREWHKDYGSQGLVVIGNHYPEFDYEADLENLEQAIRMLDVPYAVAQDNEGVTWRAYNNHYWPTLYLIDKAGHIRYRHIGEGAYEETEAAIQALLQEN